MKRYSMMCCLLALVACGVATATRAFAFGQEGHEAVALLAQQKLQADQAANNPKATADAFQGGWCHSGELAVGHPDGYIELRDRMKDSSLLREQCFIDGAWAGTPSNPVTNPVNGIELAKVPKFSTATTITPPETTR